MRGIVLYRERVPAWQYVVLGLACLVWLFAIPFAVFLPVDNHLMEALFSWLPGWFFQMRFVEHLDQYSPSSLWMTGILMLLVGIIPGPLVEELYYRGFLLPRIGRLRAWAPLINTALFALYHFYQPWRYPSIIVAFLPMVYVVWWKRNVYLGITVHCALLAISALGMLAPVLGQM